LLIDVAKNTNKKLAFNFADYLKPDLKTLVLKIFRETYNFFKHADKDHNDRLPVSEIAKMNLLQLAVCAGNYKSVYGEMTDHMLLIYPMSRLTFPDGFEMGDQKQIFDDGFTK
jgi:hypothetical protein